MGPVNWDELLRLLEDYGTPHDDQCIYDHVCQICRGPMTSALYNDDEDVQPWLADSTLLSSVERNASGGLSWVSHNTYVVRCQGVKSDTEIILGGMWERQHPSTSACVLPLKGEYRGDDWVVWINNTRTEIVAGKLFLRNCDDTSGLRRSAGDRILSLFFHSACFQIAERFIGNETSQFPHPPPRDLDELLSGNLPVTSMSRLFEVVLARGELHDAELFFDPEQQEQAEPHNYYLPSAMLHGKFYDLEAAEKKYLYTSPLEDLVDSTPTILSNLKPVVVAEARAFQQRLFSRLRSTMNSVLDNASLQDRSSLPNYWWRDSLSNGILFPWLWDLDKNAIIEKDNRAPSGFLWDWELLARELSQRAIHEPGYSNVELTLAVKQRRRVWRLLQVARVGDTMACMYNNYDSLALAGKISPSQARLKIIVDG